MTKTSLCLPAGCLLASIMHIHVSSHPPCQAYVLYALSRTCSAPITGILCNAKLLKSKSVPTGAPMRLGKEDQQHLCGTWPPCQIVLCHRHCDPMQACFTLSFTCRGHSVMWQSKATASMLHLLCLASLPFLTWSSSPCCQASYHTVHLGCFLTAH